MGLADIIPGVSGGTIALITGIYEELIDSIKSIDPRIVFNLVKGDLGSAKEDFQKIRFDFLIPLSFGIGLAFLMASRVVSTGMEDFPAFTFSFFFGLILASALVVFKGINIKSKPIALVTGLIGFLFASIVVVQEGTTLSNTFPMIFFSGYLAICAMLLPGISGAFILLFLGQYHFMLSALESFSTEWPVIIIFVLGAVLGLISFSRIIHYLLENYRASTLGFLGGLMLGALRSLLDEVLMGLEGAANSSVLISVLFGVVGFSLVTVFQIFGNIHGTE